MNGSIDDAKVTGFALGDLEGEERAEVERAVAQDPELAARVEAIRQATEAMTRGFAAQPLPVPPVRAPRPRPSRWGWWVAAMTAAVLVVGTWHMHRLEERREASSRCNVAITTVDPASLVDSEGICETRGKRNLARNLHWYLQEGKDGDYNESQDGADVSTRGFAAAYGATPSEQTETRLKAELRGARDLNGDGNDRLFVAKVYGTAPSPGFWNIHAQPGPGWAGLPPGVQGPPRADEPSNTEGYDHITENAFLTSADDPLSTFSIDVDTASYANVRRFLTGGALPPPDAVRIEELVNYFTYAYPGPTDDRPFAVHMEMASCPWNAQHQLLRIGLKGRTLDADKRPPSNLVFLLDVSGSMDDPRKLPLVKAGIGMLVNQLGENDRVSIVVYAGNSGLVLPPTHGDRKADVQNALERLQAGGSTNGGAGIELAYKLATDNFITGGTNRVILATDGDWNVGATSHGDLETLIADKAKSGVFLTVLGFGMGNLKDDTLERLADKGNGNYAYIDTLNEAKKVLVEQMSGTLCTIAKDVKLQIEFNPARIAGYRLIGYENRMLAKEDFNDDKKDAGEIGAGHTVTALYELVPAGVEVPGAKPGVDPLKYQQPKEAAPAAASLDLCTVKLRYKAPEATESTLMEVPLKEGRARFDDASGDFRFAAAVAGYGMLLRHSQYAKGFTWDAVSEIASGAVGEDGAGYRHEFLDLVKKAKALSGK